MSACDGATGETDCGLSDTSVPRRNLAPIAAQDPVDAMERVWYWRCRDEVPFPCSIDGT